MGDLLLDVTVLYDPGSGELDTGPEAVQIWPGGSAANFAVYAARLGADVRYISRVGRDWAGEMLVRSLTSEGIATCVPAIEEEPSGRVLVMVDPEGHRRMWSYPGASATLSVQDLDPDWFKGIDAFHLTGYSLLREGPRAATLEALRLARLHGTPFLTLDPNPPHLIDDYGPRRFREVITGLRFEALFPNLDEGRLLTGLDNPEDVARDLLEVSPLVALKLGGDGCLVARGEQLFHAAAGKPGQVVDATGAGDAFAAAFVVEYLDSRDPHKAADSANRLAAQVVSRLGAR